jgi:integrase
MPSVPGSGGASSSWSWLPCSSADAARPARPRERTGTNHNGAGTHDRRGARLARRASVAARAGDPPRLQRRHGLSLLAAAHSRSGSQGTTDRRQSCPRGRDAGAPGQPGSDFREHPPSHLHARGIRRIPCRVPAVYRDHFLAPGGIGLRLGELLGLRRRRVQPERRRIEVLEVRYEAGKFGRGFKERPKSPASIRVVPMADAVREAIVRQLPSGSDPNDLVFAGPGGNRWAKRGTRPALSTHNYRRAYKAAIVKRAKKPDGTVAVLPRFPHLDLHDPHDLRRTFATWLEEAGIPSRVIDEVMGHVSTKRERASGTSPMGRVYRETTEAMAARVADVLDERLALACRVAAGKAGGNPD